MKKLNSAFEECNRSRVKTLLSDLISSIGIDQTKALLFDLSHTTNHLTHFKSLLEEIQNDLHQN